VECCRDYPSGRFSQLHRGTLELCQSDHRVLGHLGFLVTLASQPGPGKVLVVPNFFHLRMMEANVFLDLQSCRNVLVPFPRSVPRHNPISELYGQFLQPHSFVFALTCTVNCGTLYRQVCAFPNHTQSIEFTTGGVQSSCTNI
jgi:hypothetical protein